MIADGRLGQIEFPGRPGKAPVSEYGKENLEMMHVHMGTF
jgi:hypothetical protein